jgi:hypothetical protein
MSSNAIAKREDANLASVLDAYTSEQVEMIRRTVAQGANDIQIKLFLEFCQRRGLDPITKQVYWTPKGIITAIDGFRAKAEETGCYRPGATVEIRDDQHRLLAVDVTVYKKSDNEWWPVTERAYRDEYDAGTPVWKRMPYVMTAKCFDSETEVLTDEGFQRFAEVHGRVMQVTPDGLEPTFADPWSRDYDGPMVTLDSDDLNFCVTPNHDMLTTRGKVEAGEMYEAARSRETVRIPRTVHTERPGINMAHRQIALAAIYLADGYDTSRRSFSVGVSREYKIEQIEGLNLHRRETVAATSGAVAIGASGRAVVTKMDKRVFSFEHSHVGRLVAHGKRPKLAEFWRMSRDQARTFVDTLLTFDGADNGNGTRRFFTSNETIAGAFEVAAVIAGYAVSPRRPRTSDLSDTPNYCITVSERSDVPVFRHGRDYHGLSNANAREATGLELTPNASGKVWCVTVPSGVIVVRRKGFSMLCGNCAEARAIRRAFPQHFGGMYAAEELERANDGEAREASKPRTEGLIDRIRAARPEVADALEMHMPRTAPAEPEALDADELDQFAEAVAVDDLREEPVETYIGEAGAEELAGLIKNAYGAKAIGKASDRISEKYGRPSLEWLTPLEAAQVRETIAADRAAKAAKATK